MTDAGKEADWRTWAMSQPDYDVRIGLDAIRRQIRHWIDFDNLDGQKADDAHLIAPPTWPSHGQLKAWVKLFEMIDGRLAASGSDTLAGYAGVKDAEVNKPLPTQGGGAGDLLRALQERAALADRVRSVEFEYTLDQDEIRVAIAALQAAPSEGGEPEPIAWTCSADLESLKGGHFRSGMFWGWSNKQHPIPLYARPPAPSEEPLVGCVVVPRADLEALSTFPASIKAAARARDWARNRLIAAPAPDAIRGGE